MELWKRVLKAIGRLGPSYTGPSYNALRTSYIERAKAIVHRHLDDWFKQAERTGLVLMSNGWTDLCSRPVINILASSPKGAYFVRAPDVSAAPEKNAQFLFELWAKAIEEDLGEDKVYAVITDGAAVNKAAGALLEARFPHMTWVHCTSHALDLCLEDICKLQHFADAIREAKHCLHFITKHQRSHAIYRQQKDHKELLRPGETRFYTAHIMLGRMVEMKEPLQRTVLSAEWTEWADKPAYREEAAKVKELILDGAFWKRAADAVEIFEPIVKLLRLCDADYATMGKVYYYCSLIEQRIRASSLSASLQADCCRIFRKRWDGFNSILHCAAFAVDPEFVDLHLNAEVQNGFKRVCKKILPDFPAVGKAVMQLAAFRNKEGAFSDVFLVEMEKDMPAYQWWQMNGTHCPELSKVAIIVLAMMSSAGACERNWSAHDVIQTKKRNRLHPKRLEDLVYLYCNLRLINKMRADELFAEWDEEE